ncbi:MAG: phage major capsid protein [Nitrospira sp.]|nr:phage major capsid protein [Nitrospira sp.]
MAFANVSDIIATTIENRSKKVADNVTKNNAILAKLKAGGRRRPFCGGRLIYEELSFAENANAGWYSGYDILPVGVSDVISAAEFDIKQAAAPVTISGLEMLQNAGKEQMIDLLEARVNVAESTMMNLISGGLYSDGTGAGGKEITGLDAAVPLVPTTGTYGGIDRATWSFWRSKVQNSADATTLLADMNLLWSQLVRGADRPDLIMMDGVVWQAYVAALQANQRFTQPNTGEFGFPTLKFMDADVVLDGGIGGFCPAGTAFFLNTKYIHYRPHSQREFVPLSPNKRYAVNQDAEVQIMAWAGNLTTSGAQFQGRLDVNA